MTERGGDCSDLHVVKNAPEARQAVTGHNARYVLIDGLVAVIVLFAMVYGYYFR